MPLLTDQRFSAILPAKSASMSLSDDVSSTAMVAGLVCNTAEHEGCVNVCVLPVVGPLPSLWPVWGNWELSVLLLLWVFVDAAFLLDRWNAWRMSLPLGGLSEIIKCTVAAKLTHLLS